VGRAGRDGDPAKCTLLLSKQDVIRQHSLSYSHTLGALQIVSLFRRLFIPKTDSLCTTQGESIEFLSEVAISLQQSEQEGDISGMDIRTLHLCFCAFITVVTRRGDFVLWCIRGNDGNSSLCS
jgi:hypothetical protein